MLQNEIITHFFFSSVFFVLVTFSCAMELDRALVYFTLWTSQRDFENLSFFFSEAIVVRDPLHHVKFSRKQRCEAAICSFVTKPGSGCSSSSCWWPPGSKTTATSPRCIVSRMTASFPWNTCYISDDGGFVSPPSCLFITRRSSCSNGCVKVETGGFFFSLSDCSAFVIFINFFFLQQKQPVRLCLYLFSLCVCAGVLTGWVVSHLQQHTLLLSSPLLPPPLPSLFPLLTK